MQKVLWQKIKASWGEKKGRLTGNKASIGQLAPSSSVPLSAYQHMRREK